MAKNLISSLNTRFYTISLAIKIWIIHYFLINSKMNPGINSFSGSKEYNYQRLFPVFIPSISALKLFERIASLCMNFCQEYQESIPKSLKKVAFIAQILPPKNAGASSIPTVKAIPCKIISVRNKSQNPPHPLRYEHLLEIIKRLSFKYFFTKEPDQRGLFLNNLQQEGREGFL